MDFVTRPRMKGDELFFAEWLKPHQKPTDTCGTMHQPSIQRDLMNIEFEIDVAILEYRQTLENLQKHERKFEELIRRLVRVRNELESCRADREKFLALIQWIASQQNLFFAECTQAEEIVSRCHEALKT